MGRLLVLLFALFATSSAMGYFGGGGYDRPEPTGDWPDEFPDKPEGFAFKCNGKCYCPCQCASETVAPAVTSTVKPTTPSTTTVKPTTPTTTTTVRPTYPTTPTTPTTRTVRPTYPTTPTTPTTTTTIPPTEPEVLATDTVPLNGNQNVKVVVQGGEVAMDEPVDNGLPTKEPQTGTTFWIRSPTPPNHPDPVNPGGDLSLGHATFAAPKIVDPFAPDQAIDPLNAAVDADLDFGIKTVGTPKAPRAVIDPDA